MTKHTGFVAIIGRPNVGKSSLLNLLTGTKLAAVSSKPQTTRGTVRGIVTKREGQIIFVDTPGHHEPKNALGAWMLDAIRKTLESVDLLYWMVFPKLPEDQEVQPILKLLKESSKPVFLLINQIDWVAKPELLPVIEAYSRFYSFTEVIPISVKTGAQIPVVIKSTFEHLPKGDYLFPEDQISDQNEKYFVQEMIREKIFRFTGEEIPYAAAVTIDSFKERDNGIIAISATVAVEKDSQKGIIIGKGGEKMKQIGQAARLEIEKFLGKKVFLEMWVKVIPDWNRRGDLMKQLGYE